MCGSVLLEKLQATAKKKSQKKTLPFSFLIIVSLKRLKKGPLLSLSTEISLKNEKQSEFSK
jgi:hypothetical protein